MHEENVLINGKCMYLYCDETTLDHSHYGVLIRERASNKLLGRLGGGGTPVKSTMSSLVMSKSIAEQIAQGLNTPTHIAKVIKH